MKKTLALILLSASTSAAFAWDGYDYENGSFVAVETGNLVRSGNTIEIFDYGTGSYHEVDVYSIERSGSNVQLEVYDNETGEYRTLEMDD